MHYICSIRANKTTRSKVMPYIWASQGVVMMRSLIRLPHLIHLYTLKGRKGDRGDGELYLVGG